MRQVDKSGPGRIATEAVERCEDPVPTRIDGGADLADQDAPDRARIGMVGATAGLAGSAPSPGAIGAGVRNVLSRLRPAGRAQGGPAGGSDRPTGDRTA